MSEIKVGDKAILKVGNIEVTVQVIRPMGNGKAFWVKNLANGKEFIMPSGRLHVPTVSIKPVPAAEPPAAESATRRNPEKKLSLLDAAVEALKAAGKPMNTREMVKVATEKGYWIPTSCKTPEQTLYGSIFREMKVKEHPRIVKAEEKGKFRIA